ncbi:MAG: YbaB/EbfC family nucleoid-associated protein [Planctomycetota bacterium]|nr:MAG: YbaB/EbfC family nucleoid-associated protein [Planctomycetota bacterium]
MAGSLGDLGGLLRQAQQMQRQMTAKQEELARRRFEASAGGAVRAVVSGDRRLLELRIDPAAADPEDVAALEDAVLTAVNEALRQAAETAAEELGKLSGGLGLPGGLL